MQVYVNRMTVGSVDRAVTADCRPSGHGKDSDYGTELYFLVNIGRTFTGVRTPQVHNSIIIIIIIII
jgi:hypothetical protein